MYNLDERFSSLSLAAHCRRHQPPHREVLDDFGNDAEREHQGLYQRESTKIR